MFHQLFEKVNKFYEYVFRSYGRLLSRYYVQSIVCTLLVNGILLGCMFNFKLIEDTDSLFMPMDSQARHDERLVKQLYNNRSKLTGDFFIHQLLDLGTWAEVNFQSCSPDTQSHNIINESLLMDVRAINEHLLSRSVVQANGTRIDFESVCARRNGRCLIDGVDLLDKQFYHNWLENSMDRKTRFYEEQEFLGSADAQAALSKEFRFYIKFDSSGPSITDLTYNLGREFRVNAVNESDNGRVPGFARAVKLRYNLKSDFENIEADVKLWELEFLKHMRELYETRDHRGCVLFNDKRTLRISFAASQSLELEMAANLSLDTMLISGTFTLIMIFVCLLMSIRSNMVTSPGVMLPMAGILAAMFGMVSAFGFLNVIGYTGCNLIFVIPFLVIGIGVDDMFIIYSSFVNAYKAKLKTVNKSPQTEQELVTELISRALAKSGVSITITSLTDFVAFIVGVTTNFRSVQIFCVYAGFSIAFCYVYQLTFFSAFLCLHVKRILAKRNSFLFCFKQDSFARCHCCNNFICCIDLPSIELDSTSNKNSSNVKSHELVELNEPTKSEPPSMEIELATDKEDKSGKSTSKALKTNKLVRLFRRLFRFMICTRRGKILGVLIFLFYISLSAWSAYHIKEGINLSDLVAEDSYYAEYMNDNTKLTDLNPLVMFVVHEPIDYDNIHVRMKLKNFMADAFKIDGINRNFSINWLESFGNSKIRYKKSLNNLMDKLKNFPPFLNDLIIKKRLVDLKTNQTISESLFKLDDLQKSVNRSEHRAYEYEISASRFYVQYSRLTFSSQDAKPMHLLRKLCLESGLPVFAYSITFKFYEQFEQTLPNVLQAFVIAVEAMYLISLVFIPDLVSVFCIIFSMGSILLGLIGLMSLWGLSLSSVTMIELIMSVGFCVDFSAHLTHAFISNSGKGDRNRRAYKACMNVGIPIFNSALSTIIGICLLAFSKSYIFKSFFKTMFIIMSLGLLNSMLFLPILLSLVGPNWPRHKLTPALNGSVNESAEKSPLTDKNTQHI